MTGARRSVSLGLVLLATLFVLLLGLLLKSPCNSGDWADGRPYRRLCYSDIVPLFRAEGLSSGRFPYLDAPNEYPVGTGLIMGLAAWPVHTESDFFLTNAALLMVAALVTALLLYELAGARALYFALAPTLLLYAFLNWDLVAVALATGGTFAYLRRRDALAGVLIGLGAVAKIYPAFLLVPFVLGRLRERRRREAGLMTGAAAGTWLAFNVPFAIANYGNWSLFFRFNARRAVDWTTVWYAWCDRASTGLCHHPSGVAILGLALLVSGAVLVYVRRRARDPEFPRWTLGFPLIVLFLLTTKVYSPQYSLWLLPWFALVLPDIRLFAAFEVADVASFVTVFRWLGRYTRVGGWPLWPLEVAVLVRAAVLVALLVAYTTAGSRIPQESLLPTVEAA